MASIAPQSEEMPSNSFWHTLPLIKLFKFYFKKWWILAIAGLFAGIAGILYAGNQKPEFESRLTFSVDAGTNEGALSGAMNLAAQFGLGFGSVQNMFDGDNILEIMKSRRMVEQVLLTADTFNGRQYSLVEFFLESSGLKKSFENNERLKAVSFAPGIKKGSLTYLQDSVLFLVYSAFSSDYIVATRPDKKLSIYEIRVRSRNEKFSKIFTDRLVEATGNFYSEITSKKDKETLEILEQRVASLKGNVNTSIDARTGTQDANVNPAFAKAQSPLLKQQYNMEAYGEAYKEMFKTLELARYQYLKKIPLLQIIDYADYPMKKIKIGRLKTGIVFAIFTTLFTMLSLSVYHLARRS